MARPQYEPWVREILRCPVGGHELIDITEEQGGPALQCAEDCGGAEQRRRYPIVDGIPVLLADDAEIVSSGESAAEAEGEATADSDSESADG
ncbi:Trm112 family protein [Ornithinimicrobium sp. Y1847]|uniref:Trm112 family protein n=1 Tax=unclassified Ornithinimicrobium TaxID=2615080 RepID=UPI003B66B103